MFFYEENNAVVSKCNYVFIFIYICREVVCVLITNNGTTMKKLNGIFIYFFIYLFFFFFCTIKGKKSHAVVLFLPNTTLSQI